MATTLLKLLEVKLVTAKAAGQKHTMQNDHDEQVCTVPAVNKENSAYLQ